MRRTYLGEFEEIVLLMVAILDGEGYGVTVSQALEEHTGRIVTFGTVHNTLIRLEEKGFVSSYLGGATTERGGRRKRLFRVTALGSRALQEIQQLRQELWQMVPPNTLRLGGV
ncbi:MULTISPECIES: PadR family transcriptional regulator [Spirosoma]|uniref:PadR family transcriptional regulator n=1 Tax=Spirosoma TaxID=107 RepID=UPI00095E1F61|nr:MULTISPECIES: PadR family transcriptional regulator [Spirosoma]MBN8824357.1 PadR family transcriptional regulator [Spirosoma sp.]OJW70180.1 MAG: PadR family transcriptional regulator [Spirosoma sp. 48-14]